VIVTGAGGMVGQAVSKCCRSLGDEVVSYTHQSLDISDQDLVEAAVDHDRPDAVINCAAWTNVDGCESDQARAFGANANGPENLARASRKVGALLVSISTDYVFDGTKAGFYTQRDSPNPQSVYAISKLEGERRAQLADARTIIVRTGFLFGHGGINFLSTVLQQARTGEKLKAITDAYGMPTYSRHLAARLRELAQLDLPGTYHVVNSGNGASYEEFARAALETAGQIATIETITMESLHRPAPRPRNSRLKCLLSEAIGLPPLPDWREALRDYAGGQSSSEIAARG
jgi:dTDP-4-dehydrorhamnose reductase